MNKIDKQDDEYCNYNYATHCSLVFQQVWCFVHLFFLVLH